MSTPPQPIEPSPERPVWHWFMLITPSLEMLVVCGIADKMRLGEEIFGVLMLNLLVFTLLCFGLGLWWSWKHVGLGLLVGCGLLLLNGLLSFAGCSLGIMK